MSRSRTDHFTFGVILTPWRTIPLKDPMTPVRRPIGTAIAVATALIALGVRAENWIMVDESTPSTGPQTVYVDSDSFRSDLGYLIYRIKIEANWFNSGRLVVIERFVIADCRENRRFEATTLRELAERNFKSVFPGTTAAKELAVACQRQIAGNSAPGTPDTRQPESIPRTRPEGTTNPDSTGSGVAVSSTAILTNAHVIADCKHIAVRQGSSLSPAQTIAMDERIDLALLATQRTLLSQAKLRTSAMLGEDIMVAGYPLAGLLGSDLIVTGGQVNSLAGLGNDPTLLQISAPVQPGNSGGPIVDRYGLVVGIVVSKLNVSRVEKITGDVAQNINFAIKPELVRLFLDANSVKYLTGQAGTRLEGTELAQIARGFTFQVLCFNQ